MPRETPRCERCQRPSVHARGLCFACYLRQRRGHETNAPCAVCRIDDPRVLRRHQLAEGRTVLCANHAAIAGRRLITIRKLRAECAAEGDRRGAEDRRRQRRRAAERRRRVDVERLAKGDKRKAERRKR